MPTYNYYCGDCNAHFSYFQKMSESPISNCENCKGKLKRIITGGTGLIFKGSGFYLTDYKDKKKSESPANDSKLKVGSSDKNKSAKSVNNKEKKTIEKKENKK
jgi:putative FmdB family regulatory protein